MCDAFRSATDPSHSAWVPLHRLIASGVANICMTSVHLIELAGWQDATRADAAGQWLDALPIVWMESAADIDLAECKVALLRELGAQVPPFSPFLGSFVQLFTRGLTPVRASAMLECATVAAFLTQARGRNLGPLRAYSVSLARDLSMDRKRAVDEGFSDEEILEVFLAAERAGYTRFVERADRALREEDGYRNHLIDVPSEVELRQAIHRIVSDRRSLPAVRATSEAMSRFALRVRVQDPSSQRFAKHQSSWPDMVHCGAGAAYCDVFTCDARTASDLGDFRERIGRKPQLAQRESGGPSKLIQSIENQLADVRVTLV